MGVPCPHVFQPILNQANWTSELPGEVAAEDGMLDSALDAIAAADVDVVMDSHGIGGQAHGESDLVGIFGHLDGCPHVQNPVAMDPTK